MLRPIFDIVTQTYTPPDDTRAQEMRKALEQALPLLYAYCRISSEGATTINWINEILKECE